MAKIKKDYTTVAADGTVLVHMAPKKQMKLSLTKRKALSGWLLVLPFILGLIFIYGPILISSLLMVFSSATLESTGVEYDFTTGFDNIKWAFNLGEFKETGDPWFIDSLLDGFKDLVIQVPAIIIFSLFMAIILNQKMVGRAAFRAIFFLPVILSIGIIDAIDANAALSLDSITGGIDDGTSGMGGSDSFISMMDLTMMLQNVQVGAGFIKIAQDLVSSIFDIVSRSGVQMLIFLSGLQSISPAVYESCQIDGASGWETFWKITLPMISPMILVNSVYTLIDAFTSSGNGVIKHIFQDITSTQISAVGLSRSSVVTAEMWVYVLIISIVVVLVALLMKAFVFYQKRD